MTIKEGAILLGAVFTVIGVLVKWVELSTTFTKLVVALIGFLRTFLFGNAQMLAQLVHVNRRLEEHGEMLRTLDAETKYNGGSTIKDQLRSIRDGMLFMWATQESQNAALDLPIFYCGLDGRCTKVSAPLADLFGMDQQNLLGYGWMIGIHQDDRERVASAWQRTLSDGYPFDVDYRLVGGQRVHVITQPVTDAHGSLCGYHGVVRQHLREEDVHANLQHRRRATDL